MATRVCGVLPKREESMRRSLYSFFLAVLLYNVLFQAPASAQTGRGTIAGTAKDEANSALSSALIEIQPLGRRAVSDDQGQFRIADVPAGEYTLTVSYVFLRWLCTVQLNREGRCGANGERQCRAEGRFGERSGHGPAERARGEAEAINIERMAENIVQVLPAEVITSLPNTNVADAVGRVPSVTLERDEGEGKYVQIRGTEPRLSNVTIDGVNVPSPEATVRNIKLDVVPSSLVDRIEVNKTLAPNQDADAIGGSVNLVTRTPGERPTY